MNETTENVPILGIKNVPLEKKILKRRYINEQKIKNYVTDAGTRGITYSHIQTKFRCNKKQAQRTLKYFHARNYLFTVRDLQFQKFDLPPTFRNRRPQRYYSTTIRAKIIEKIKEDYRNGLLSTTGMDIKSSAYSGHSATENSNARTFLELLRLLPLTTRYIHKINLFAKIEKQYYGDIDREESGKTKTAEENIGKSHVTYKYFPNGSVQIFMACSRHPYPIENEEDVNLLLTVFGQVKDRLTGHLHDYRENFVPSINSWILKQCDINADIETFGNAQIYFPSLQIKTAVTVFRMYVKSLGDRSIYRLEESKEIDSPLLSSLNMITHPYQAIANKLDILSNQLNEIISDKGRLEKESRRPFPYLRF